MLIVIVFPTVQLHKRSLLVRPRLHRLHPPTPLLQSPFLEFPPSFPRQTIMLPREIIVFLATVPIRRIVGVADTDMDMGRRTADLGHQLCR